MKFLLAATAIAGVSAAVSPALAQYQPPGTPPYYTPPPYPNAQPYYGALDPEDAYRSGLINRWQLEQLEGPTPQALQGPSPNSDRGADVR